MQQLGQQSQGTDLLQKQLVEAQEQKQQQNDFFQKKIQEMEQQVKLFVEGEQKQYFQKAQEKDAAHQAQIEELE